ncbi:MAG: hypothetical protein OXI41_13970 [Chloroflexota bacterium]|nr:hypothetical protein [Chloroflexota bacterium]
MSRLPCSRCLMGLGVALLVTGVALVHSIGPFLILAGHGALTAGVGPARRGKP